MKNNFLILYYSPDYPLNFEDDSHDEFRFIKVMYLSRNNSPVLQPMDHQMGSNFKKFYTKHLFCRCFEVTKNTLLELGAIQHCKPFENQLRSGRVADDSATEKVVSTSYKKAVLAK